MIKSMSRNFPSVVTANRTMRVAAVGKNRSRRSAPGPKHGSRVSPVLLEMKMLRPDQVESDESVERRARSRLSQPALFKAALLAGLFVYVVPSGGPWMSHEAFTNVMGRIMSPILLVDLIGQLALALVYGWIVAAFIYRQPTGAGIGLGVGLSLPLWGLNCVFFRILGGMQANELHTFLAHFEFCLFFSVAYRALAVPRPKIKDESAAQPAS